MDSKYLKAYTVLPFLSALVEPLPSKSTTIISVNSLQQLSLVEFRDEKACPQLQLGDYKKV
jgi:hypothetical protein